MAEPTRADQRAQQRIAQRLAQIGFAGFLVVTKARAENVIGRNDTFERGLDDLLWGGGNYVEMKMISFGKIL